MVWGCRAGNGDRFIIGLCCFARLPAPSRQPRPSERELCQFLRAEPPERSDVAVHGTHEHVACHQHSFVRRTNSARGTPLRPHTAECPESPVARRPDDAALIVAVTMLVHSSTQQLGVGSTVVAQLRELTGCGLLSGALCIAQFDLLITRDGRLRLLLRHGFPHFLDVIARRLTFQRKATTHLLVCSCLSLALVQSLFL